MKTFALILAVAAAVPPTAPARAQDAADPSAGKVEELRKERVAVLKALAETSGQLLRNGVGTLEAALEARESLFEAELDAAETETARLALRKGLVDAAKEFEELAKARKQAANGTEADVLKARLKRLEAEILLERASVGTIDRGRPKVVTANPIVKDVDVVRRYVCTIAARRHIEVRSLQCGYLEEVPLKEGQAVKRGDLLFKIAPALFQARLDAATAEAKIADLELANAESLFKHEVISKGEVERSRAKWEGARARAKLAVAELDSTAIRAPFDGLVDRIGMQQGSLVTNRDVLTTLSDTGAMWVYFNVPEARHLEYEADRDGRELADRIELKLADGSTFPLPGKIAAIAAEVDGETGNVAFRADFPNPDGLLRHGQTGSAVMRRILKDATVIPQAAAFDVLGKRYVYVVDGDEVARRREIEVQDESDGLFVVKRGLGVGDRIVVDGLRQVRDGEKVSAESRKPGDGAASPDR